MDNSVNQEELAMLELARSGDTEALEYFFSKYQSVIYWKSTQYFLQGAERDDLIQEAMIGLFKAIRDYDKTKEASFRSFAEMCINRQLLSAVKRASRQKNIPLNNSVSLDTPMAEDDVDWTLLDVISEKAAETPEDFLIKNEDFIHVARQLEQVTSEFEKEVLKQYLEGKSYQEMALYFNKKEKAIDNALQRVKKKMMKQLE
ncbi:RNA polymerase sporulation sigma factor SigH [Listeria monocytogenes]|uniref:RNA polymerase sporulation sigma factor SigH n=1 Tax=Listeria monocytogenes TaxID=1639 RepID=UPI00087382FD|nr:RNA polymerase sporulation sigma factor SigH [Listeria monocytogenes]EAD8370611.1 RNA polymerase sporulation sigma factor SigH [Listeria monocytogenes]EGI8087425.1 RNA polymerase sporulation sigma factor SigH [Listeria monocytogenes]EHE4683041.1 RNA polymerase sporulation sigma factor SigH [Listeria monocytogenes]EHS5048086.1 RNA polymerase sporulation sigma factor SigH [Listeria monocytogenes]EKZ0296178.1 RNA polymerase sporulation sigma factor SigH [Listeria monocytogenes]